MNFKIYSFFSGVGFLDLGFEKSGYQIQLVNEFSDAFLQAYKYARTHMQMPEPIYGYYNCDVNDFLKGSSKQTLLKLVNNDKEDSLVGFIGGPPCPDFSIAGKNKGMSGNNGKLTICYKNLILQNVPDFFVFENVKGLWSTKKHREEYEKLKLAFKRKGYFLIDKLANSLEYGVPQERERIILFGVHKSVMSIPPKKAKLLLQNNFNFGIVSQLSAKEIKQLPWPEQTPYNQNQLLSCPAGIDPELSIEFWFIKNNVYNHPNANDYFQPREGTEKMNTINEGDVSRKSFKRLHRWRYSPTVAYGNNEVHLHPYKSRRLSVAEALSLQSLPINFILDPALSLSDKFKTIGNGVPFLMSKNIAQCIKTFLETYADKNQLKEDIL